MHDASVFFLFSFFASYANFSSLDVSRCRNLKSRKWHKWKWILKINFDHGSMCLLCVCLCVYACVCVCVSVSESSIQQQTSHSQSVHTESESWRKQRLPQRSWGRPASSRTIAPTPESRRPAEERVRWVPTRSGRVFGGGRLATRVACVR